MAQVSAAQSLPDRLLEQAERLQEQVLSSSEAWSILESLTTEVGPRPAGSGGDQAAVAWALLKFEELGFLNVRTEDVEVPHWVRGKCDVEITTPFPQSLVATALGGSIGTDREGIEAPILRVRNIEELEELPPSRVEGAIVFFDDPMEATRDGSSYMRVRFNRGRGPSAAARMGARGVVIRSAGTTHNRIAHTGATKYDDDAPRIPAVAISNPDADLLSRQLATGQPVTVRMKLTSRYLANSRSANVIGELPGRGNEDEIILLGAHLDSWDLGRGAQDDGAGVAIVMEAVRQIVKAGLQPRRTLRVVLYADEELRLSGAKAYAERHADQLGQHILGLEADMGSGRVWRLDSRVPEGALGLVEALYPSVAPLGVERGHNEASGGADISTMRKLGMPVLGPRQDATRYFEIHHTVNDTLDKVIKGELDQNVAVYATLAFLAASIEQDFGRLPPEEGPNGSQAPGKP